MPKFTPRNGGMCCRLPSAEQPLQTTRSLLPLTEERAYTWPLQRNIPTVGLFSNLLKVYSAQPTHSRPLHKSRSLFRITEECARSWPLQRPPQSLLLLAEECAVALPIIHYHSQDILTCTLPWRCCTISWWRRHRWFIFWRQFRTCAICPLLLSPFCLGRILLSLVLCHFIHLLCFLLLRPKSNLGICDASLGIFLLILIFFWLNSSGFRALASTPINVPFGGWLLVTSRAVVVQ